MAINVPKVKPGDLITSSYWNLVVDSLVSLQNRSTLSGRVRRRPAVRSSRAWTRARTRRSTRR